MRGKHRAFIIYIVSLLLNEKVSRLFFFTLRYKSTIINKNDEKKGKQIWPLKEHENQKKCILKQSCCFTAKRQMSVRWTCAMNSAM